MAVYAAQPREGTETYITLDITGYPRRAVYAAQPREGTETARVSCHPQAAVARDEVYAAQPREGTETLLPNLTDQAHYLSKVYAAQPREGTETRTRRLTCAIAQGLCSSTPRGDGNAGCARSPTAEGSGLCSSTPRGDGNDFDLLVEVEDFLENGLCSSTPRGDGNFFDVAFLHARAVFKVYAAQPREGTETWKKSGTKHEIESRFMQLNPARGRKLPFRIFLIGVSSLGVYAAQPREGTETVRAHPRYLAAPPRRFMQLNPARGRKLAYFRAIAYELHLVYAAQPREGTETDPVRQCCHLSCEMVYAAQPREGTETT